MGRRPVEHEFREETLVWPDLVYIELICALLVSAALVVWSMVLRAPLEQPADPAMGGVVLPTLIVLGLLAIPYLDPNPKGSGYYSIAGRRFGYAIFQLGFLQLWVLLILIGTFFRGPSWGFFGLYEPRDPLKVQATANVKLSEAFWATWLGGAVPQPSPASGGLARLGAVLWRETPGLVVLGVYFAVLPIVLGRTLLRSFRRTLGCGRYWIMALLLLMMIAVPLKMLLRWTCDLSYVVSMPEYFFNF